MTGFKLIISGALCLTDEIIDQSSPYYLFLLSEGAEGECGEFGDAPSDSTSKDSSDEDTEASTTEDEDTDERCNYWEAI